MLDHRDGKVTALTQILDKYLASRGLLGKSRQMLAALVWAEVVGPWYGQHTTVTRIHRGILTVTCDSAPRAQQLQLDSHQILEKLNQRLGGRFINEIRATSGRLGRGRRSPSVLAPSGTPEPPEIPREPLSPGQEQAIQELAAEIAESELRHRFMAAMRSFCRRQRWQQAHGYKPCGRCGRLIEQGAPCSVCRPGRPSQLGI